MVLLVFLRFVAVSNLITAIAADQSLVRLLAVLVSAVAWVWGDIATGGLRSHMDGREKFTGR